ncbi:rhomboid family-domain-containing protein [Roridomyces roridus]|uniref:Rhomboid-type serine protease n=1 Tax=Roridomyces roridus TaxID=1738132 RepID=A0AAD7BU70_9AGAR|nr:rhomboid family-domain-containing protein [Roridomyces roridus]
MTSHEYVYSAAPPEDEGFNPQAVTEKSTEYRPLSEYHPRAEASDASLIPNAAGMGHGYQGVSENCNAPASSQTRAADTPRNYQDLEYSDPYDVERAAQPPTPAEKQSPLQFLGVGPEKGTLQQRIEMKKRGIGRQRYPYLVWALTVAYDCWSVVFIYELVANDKAQGTPVSFHPTVNAMLGPSSTTLINVGARFPPCMKLVASVPPTTQIGCLNNTANPATEICTIEEICGFGGFHNNDPNQWFRFITPIFLHAGFIHIILNMLAQLTVSAQVEREMGSVGFFLTYFAAGIFGNVLGANFALVGRPSVGASGAIFGTVAVTWVDLFAHWRYHYPPCPQGSFSSFTARPHLTVFQLIFMTIELIIGVAVGYIPYVDNFAHLGGFFMALFVGTIFYPVISVSKRHRIIMTAARISKFCLVVVLQCVNMGHCRDSYSCRTIRRPHPQLLYVGSLCSLRGMQISFMFPHQFQRPL